jgi:UDP-glucose 4-epimerase
MEQLAGQKVVVVGGAGFIGSHIVDLLVERNARVVVFDNLLRGKVKNLERARANGDVEIVEGDIRDSAALRNALAGAPLVFHLAALWLLECESEPRTALEVNVEGTFNVLEACVDAKVKKIVFSSSSSVYGDAVYLPTDEAHPFNHNFFYAAYKVAGEELLKAFHKKYGLEYVALRYLNAYGPRQDYRSAYISVITNFINKAAAGESPIVHGDGSQTLDLVYVEDIARANLLAAASAVTNDVFNVASGQQTSLRELATMVLELMGKQGLAPQYHPAASNLVQRRQGSVEKAERLLGFRTNISVREGLARLIAWRQQDLQAELLPSTR